MKKKAHESVKEESTNLISDASQVEVEKPEDSDHPIEEVGEFENKKKLYSLGQKVFVITIIATVIVFVAWLLTT